MVGMTVGELKAALEGIEDDTRVILQEDSEGNGYRWARGVDPDGVVVEDYGWYADIYDATWTADEADMDEEEWRKHLAKKRVVIIHPVN